MTSTDAVTKGPPAAAPSSETDDPHFMLAFLNVILVLLALFILIFSSRQVAHQASTRNPESRTQREALEVEREREEAKRLRQQLARQLARLPGAVVELERGRPRIVLASGVVFRSGSAELEPEATVALRDVAAVLNPIQNRIMIEGHTDDRPIRGGRYRSNWELSTARALAVVSLLIAEGISPQRLKFVGYAEHRPRRPNDTEENRQQNRRIEIKVQR